MTGLREAAERGPQGALPVVRQHLGQRLHGDVGTLGQPVEVGGDGCLAAGRCAKSLGREGR